MRVRQAVSSEIVWVSEATTSERASGGGRNPAHQRVAGTIPTTITNAETFANIRASLAARRARRDKRTGRVD
jgi:hypothetical protein